MIDVTRHHEFLRLFTANEPAIHAFVPSLVPTREDARRGEIKLGASRELDREGHTVMYRVSVKPRAR